MLTIRDDGIGSGGGWINVTTVELARWTWRRVPVLKGWGALFVTVDEVVVGWYNKLLLNCSFTFSDFLLTMLLKELLLLLVLGRIDAVTAARPGLFSTPFSTGSVAPLGCFKVKPLDSRLCHFLTSFLIRLASLLSLVFLRISFTCLPMRVA